MKTCLTEMHYFWKTLCNSNAFFFKIRLKWLFTGASNIRPQVESTPTRTSDSTKKISNVSNAQNHLGTEVIC